MGSLNVHEFMLTKENVEKFINNSGTLLVPKNTVFVEHFPEDIEDISCARCKDLKTIPDIPASVEYFDCSYSGITFISKLPNLLYSFDCSGSDIKEIPELPASLEYFDCSNTKIKRIPQLPANLDPYSFYGDDLHHLRKEYIEWHHLRYGEDFELWNTLRI